MEEFMATRKLARACGLALAALLSTVGAARADSGFGPADAEKTLGRLRYLCLTQSLCPLTAKNYETLKRAVAGHRDDQYLLGLNLILGDGVPTDRIAGMAWVVKAAEAGAPLAARYVQGKLQDGEPIEIDEAKVAAALKPQVDSGDIDAMRALGPMMLRGRGFAQDQQAGVALLHKAAERDASGDAAYELAESYLTGTNGLDRDHGEAMRWYAVSASRGNVHAMATLGGLWEHEQDVVQSYCWRIRAAMMGMPLAQYELALFLARYKFDLVQADFWFRLGARDPAYDNSQVRGAIEPKMTTAQLDKVKKMVADWHKLDFAKMKETQFTIEEIGRTCPAMI
jgi:TPR repeat protein